MAGQEELILPAIRTGRRQLQAETRNWEQTAALIERFVAVKAEDL